MGSVSLLSGQPKEGVYVEARSESKGYYEEATTDGLGNFRLRGLLPDTTYLVKVVAKEYLGVTAVERASPDSVVVKVSFAVIDHHFCCNLHLIIGSRERLNFLIVKVK